MKIVFKFILFIVGIVFYALLSFYIFSLLQNMFVKDVEYIFLVPKLHILGILIPALITLSIYIINIIYPKSLVKKFVNLIIIIIGIILYIFTLKNNVLIKDDKIIKNRFYDSINYSYEDIYEIKIGVHESGKYSKGSFYYIIVLDDGTNIDLTLAEIKNDDIYLTIKSFDETILNKNIKRNLDKDSIKYLPEYFDEATKNIIKEILENN